MIIFLLLLVLILSFAVHTYALITYVLTRNNTHFNRFFATAMLNIILGIFISIYSLKYPTAIRGIDLRFFLWLISGIAMLLVLYIKISLTVKIIRRTRDPECFHYNFFGKKVYNEKLIKNYEYMIFFVTLPFFLLLGAYFVARLINLYFYGHL